VHRRKGAIEQPKQAATTATSIINPEEKPDLNKIILDLKVISNVSNNLATLLSMYANQVGELDPTKFKLVKQPQQEEGV
jgi:hypothetical protein